MQTRATSQACRLFPGVRGPGWRKCPQCLGQVALPEEMVSQPQCLENSEGLMGKSRPLHSQSKRFPTYSTLCSKEAL